MTETDLNLLRWTAEQTLSELRDSLNNEWHNGDEYQHLRWRIARLETFREYCDLHQRFRP